MKGGHYFVGKDIAAVQKAMNWRHHEVSNLHSQQGSLRPQTS
jgi:hypothetical protein